MSLTENKQLQRAWDAFEKNHFRMKDSNDEVVSMEEADNRRKERLPKLQELIEKFRSGELLLGDFKSKIDGQNKRFPYWGFKGMNGMMFFNMLYSTTGEENRDELSSLLKRIIAIPSDKNEAKQFIRALGGHVEGLRNEVEDLRQAPRSGSIPYFLSYFWQVQEPDTYPIYYTSMVQALSDLAIWEPSDDIAESYYEFWKLNEEIREALEGYTDLI